jgi:hypothetical protein
VKPDRDLAHTVGDARKRLADLRERTQKRREEYPEVQTGPSLASDAIRAAQWRSETWRANHDEQHAHEDVDWTGPNIVRGED